MKNNITIKYLPGGEDAEIGLCLALSVVSSPHVQLGMERFEIPTWLGGGETLMISVAKTARPRKDDIFLTEKVCLMAL